MPQYLQIILLFIGLIFFYFAGLLLTGWGIRRLCLKIIAQMEKAGAFSASKAIALPDTGINFFRVGTSYLRPKALGVLLAEGLAIKTDNGKFYLDKDKLAAMKSTLVK